MANYTKTFNETIGVKDERRGAARAVISDVAIRQGDMTLADFQEMIRSGSAVGYSPFKHFIGGDYEYDRALFKGVLLATNASLPRITELVVDVDLPDVFDKGAALIPNADPITIKTNRSFYHLEEVSVTMKGGTVVAMPVVSNIRTSDGFGLFDVELLGEGNQRVAGEVSWSARGY